MKSPIRWAGAARGPAVLPTRGPAEVPAPTCQYSSRALPDRRSTCSTCSTDLRAPGSCRGCSLPSLYETATCPCCVLGAPRISLLQARAAMCTSFNAGHTFCLLLTVSAPPVKAGNAVMRTCPIYAAWPDKETLLQSFASVTVSLPHIGCLQWQSSDRHVPVLVVASIGHLIPKFLCRSGHQIQLPAYD